MENALYTIKMSLILTVELFTAAMFLEALAKVVLNSLQKPRTGWAARIEARLAKLTAH